MTTLSELDQKLDDAARVARDNWSKFGNQTMATLSAIVPPTKRLADDATASADVCVAFILRLLSIEDRAVYDSEHRRAAVELVVARLGETTPSILQKFEVDERTQTVDACHRLSRVAIDADDQILATVAKYDGLESVKNFRERLLQTLNGEFGRAAVRPLLGVGDDIGEKLRRCLGSVISYSAAHPAEAPACFDQAIAGLEELDASLSARSIRPLVEIADVLRRVREDISTDFENSPYSKPAELALHAGLRRHPLHEAGLRLALPLEIRNTGVGVALDVRLRMKEAIGLIPAGHPVRLPELPPGSRVVEIQVTTEGSEQDPQPALAGFELSWTNADGTSEERGLELLIEAQDQMVNWDSAHLDNPYSLEAVTTAEQLVGRSMLLRKLLGTMTTTPVGSVYIHGQKRVGKTSIARVALHMLEDDNGAVTLFRDIGSINNPDPSKAIDNLTKRLTEELVRKLGLELPSSATEPDGSLAPLTDVLERAAAHSTSPIIIALDEFDRLPATLFRRTAEQDAFFTGLRSISTIDGVGLILVGGERMKLIINGPGVEINKFVAFPVDYLDRQTHWTDFSELVRRPAADYLEITDEACEAIYDLTEGNPYYAKLLCAEILNGAVERRDAVVDEREVSNAADALLRAIDPTSFSHYWEDFLLVQDAERDEMTLNRRRCILAFGATLGPELTALESDIVREGGRQGLGIESATRELRELINRQVLVENNSVLSARVKLFGRWILDRGQDQIIMTSAELRSAEVSIEQRERYRISTSESDDLADRWGIYQGKVLNGSHVREYLRQFGSPREQRMIFRILQNVHFIGDPEERSLLSDSYKILQQEMQKRHGQWKASQIVLSHLGSVGKSGLALARGFALQNRLLRDERGIMPPNQVPAAALNGATDVVFLEDFIGTGDSCCAGLQEIAAAVDESQHVHLFALSGLSAGVNRVREESEELFPQRSSIHVLHEIAISDDPFKPYLKDFADESEAADARALVEQFGTRLTPKHPWGFGRGGAAVVFSKTIPNNCLPILWSSSTGKQPFRPLFPRN